MKKNKESIDLISKSFIYYKNFLDNPTSKNLKKFIENAELYKDAFIEDSQKYIKTSSDDLISFIEGAEQNKIKETQLNLIQKDLILKNFPISTEAKQEDSYIRFKNLIDRQIQRNKGRQLTSLQMLNRMLHHFSTRLGVIQNEPSIERFKALAARPDQLRRYKDKGPIRLFNKHVNIPKHFFKAFGMDKMHNLDFNEFSISKYNYHISYDDRNGLSKVREIPRRWYVERNILDEDTNSVALSSAWLENRSDIQPLFKSFLNQYSSISKDFSLKSHELEDLRILNQTQIDSDKLLLDDKKFLLKEISLNDHEYRIFCKLSNIKFLIADSSYFKTSRQMLNKDSEIKWRDVCIFNSDILTIRSFTSDKTHVPKVNEYANSVDWVLSNEMPKLSYQTILFFANHLVNESITSKNYKNNLINFTNDK